MVFATYNGKSADTHQLTPGKTYLASPGFLDAGAVDLEDVRLRDDTGEMLTFAVSEDLFDFPESVCAVVLKSVAGFRPGEVVTLTDANNDGFLEVQGRGFFRQNLFEILDRTNVTPGSVVLDKVTGRWVKVCRVDGDLNLGICGEEGMRPLTDFDFPVCEDGVLAEPLLRCVNAEGVAGELTEGKTYQVVGVAQDGNLVEVTADTGEVRSYLASRFSSTW
jgi:hypothetical protein